MFSGNNNQAKCAGFCNCEDNNTVDTGIGENTVSKTVSLGEGNKLHEKEKPRLKSSRDVEVEEMA